MNKFTKQCVAAVASLAMAGTLCVAGAVVAGSSAWAAQTTTEKAPWDTTLDANKKGSITIHKKDRVDSQSAQGLNGAEFTVKKVSKFGTESVNLKDQDNWVKLLLKLRILMSGLLLMVITLLLAHLLQEPSTLNLISHLAQMVKVKRILQKFLVKKVWQSLIV